MNSQTTDTSPRERRRAVALAVVAVVLVAVVWWVLRDSLTTTPIARLDPQSSASTDRVPTLVDDTPLAQVPPTIVDELDRAALEPAPPRVDREAPRTEPTAAGALELRVVPSAVWIEEGVPQHLGPALVMTEQSLFLGTWLGDQWLFQFDEPPAPEQALIVWTPGAPIEGQIVTTPASGEPLALRVDLAERGHAVRCVLVYGDELRVAVDETRRATGEDVGLDLSTENCGWAELLRAGAVFAVAPLERVRPERFAGGDAYEARFDAIPDGDYELRIASGLQRGVSIDAGRAGVVVRGEDALARLPLAIDFARINREFEVEFVFDSTAIVPLQIDAVAFGAPQAGGIESAVTGRWSVPVEDGVARFTIDQRVAVPRRFMVAADGARPFFLDGDRVMAGGRFDVRMSPGAGCVVIGGGVFGGECAAPIPLLGGAWHQTGFGLDPLGCAEFALDWPAPLDASTYQPGVELWSASTGGRDGAPVRIDPSESGAVMYLRVRP